MFANYSADIDHDEAAMYRVENSARRTESSDLAADPSVEKEEGEGEEESLAIAAAEIA